VLARLLWLDAPLLVSMAGALAAFNPQFVYMHGVVSNDTLVTALCTWGLVALVWIIRRGLAVRRVLVLALLLALASLSKSSGLTLYPVAAAGALYVCWRDRVSARWVLAYAGIGLGTWLLIAGWWYYANWTAYGDPTAGNQIMVLAGRPEGAGVALAGELRGMFYSFWGLFGWFNVSPPDAYYLLPDLLIFAGAVGLGVIMMRRGHRALTGDAWLLTGLGVLFVVVFALSWGRFHMQVNVAQGRLFFPLVGVLAPGLALGLHALPRLISGGLLAAVVLPPLEIGPAYAAPAPVAEWIPPPDAAAFSVREPWSDAACLRVWTTPPDLSADARTATVSVWWQVTCEFTGYWSVFLHRIDLSRESCAAGDTGHILAQRDTMPAGGDLPFPAMRPGEVYADQFQVTLPPEIAPETARHLHLGLYDAGGTFIRAFVTAEGDHPTIGVGQCAPETLLYALGVIQ
jgi:hypothetical protein